MSTINRLIHSTCVNHSLVHSFYQCQPFIISFIILESTIHRNSFILPESTIHSSFILPLLTNHRFIHNTEIGDELVDLFYYFQTFVGFIHSTSVNHSSFIHCKLVDLFYFTSVNYSLVHSFYQCQLFISSFLLLGQPFIGSFILPVSAIHSTCLSHSLVLILPVTTIPWFIHSTSVSHSFHLSQLFFGINSTSHNHSLVHSFYQRQGLE